MEIKLLEFLLFKVTVLSLKDFMKKYKLKNNTLTGTDLQKIFNYPIYPKD